MSLREYLTQREQELLREIQAIHDQIAALKEQLVPKEGALAEVRRAKAAIGSADRIQPPQGLVDFFAGVRQMATVVAMAKRAAEIADEQALLPSHHIETTTFNEVNVELAPAEISPPELAYAHLTMKQLVVKVLREHFPGGATTREMLDFFRDAWGRPIERTNLSPQISRLFQAGIIQRHGRNWVLTECLVEEIHEADAINDASC